MTIASAQVGSGWLQSRVIGTADYRLSSNATLLEFSAVADITGDGLSEIVFSGWVARNPTPSTLGPPAPVFILSPGPDGRLAFMATTQLQALTIPGTGDPQVGDFNRDGIQDILFPGFTDYPVLPVKSTLLLGSRSGTFTVTAVGPEIASHSADTADIDGDGDLDIVVANYVNIEEFADNNRQVVALVNEGNGNFSSYRTINTVPTNTLAGATATAADFDGDGKLEFVFGDAPDNSSGWQYGNIRLVTVPGDVGAGSAFSGTASRQVALGYFDSRSAYADVQSNFSSQKSHEVETLVADLNGDGRLDIIMMNMLWSEGPDRFAPQILINQGSLGFADETDTRLPSFDTNRGASFNPVLIDINRDGHLDLVLDGGADFDNTGNVYPGHLGADILVNDGTGKFESVARTVLQAANDAMADQPFLGGRVTAESRMHFYGLSATGAPIWVQLRRGGWGDKPAVAFEYTAHSALSTGPAGIDPATRGVPGFSEVYYLHTNEAARTAVAAGQYASGLDHYLAVGRSQNLAIFAPNTIVRGGSSGDSITLTTGNEVAYGDAGNDTINGLAGNDALYGGAGNNRLEGGAGNDWADGDVGADTLQGDDGNDSVRGLDGDDLIYGGAGSDDVNGNVGNDTVYGGANADLVRGGRGSDLIYGEEGDDAHVNGNIGADTVYGGNGNDQVFGGQDQDVLYGGAGDDLLSGDLGDDTLFGGEGVDRFQIRVGGGNDVISDFSPGIDLILLTPGTTWTERSDNGAARVELSDGSSLLLAGIVHEAFSASWVAFG